MLGFHITFFNINLKRESGLLLSCNIWGAESKLHKHWKLQVIASRIFLLERWLQYVALMQESLKAANGLVTNVGNEGLSAPSFNRTYHLRAMGHNPRVHGRWWWGQGQNHTDELKFLFSLAQEAKHLSIFWVFSYSPQNCWIEAVHYHHACIDVNTYMYIQIYRNQLVHWMYIPKEVNIKDR